MKCTKCGIEEVLDYEYIEEMMEFVNMEYPVLECGKCSNKRDSGDLIPLDVYNNKYKNN